MKRAVGRILTIITAMVLALIATLCWVEIVKIIVINN